MDKRYKHMLVPLDGSELAELALPDAFDLAQLHHAQVTLLQVISPLENQAVLHIGYPQYITEYLRVRKNLDWRYLQEIYHRFADKNVPIYTVVVVGPAADMIIDFACEHSIDLVVMATHGRSGLKRWAYGSVADKVLREAGVPVLLIRAHPQRDMIQEGMIAA